MDKANLSYSGPEKDYKPQPGSDTADFNIVDGGPGPVFRSLQDLKDELTSIINQCNVIVGKCDNELSIFSLDLSKDEKMMQAAESIWSDFSSSENNYISYAQIAEIGTKNNRSSKFLTNNFKKELRKPNGSSALDIRNLLTIVLKEAQDIYNMLSLSHFDSGISAEKRLIELFFDFTSSIKLHLNRLNSFFSLPRGQRDRAIPKNEIDILSEEDAKKYQSLFLLSANGLNDEIDKDLDHLRRFFTNSSDYFYGKIIGPLINLKSKTPTSYAPDSSFTALGVWTKDVDDALNRNVVTSLYDVSDRNDKFELLMLGLEEKISLRENYLGYIRQLQYKGLIPATSLVENVSDTIFTEQEVNSNLVNSHNSLTGRLDNRSHEQYLLKSNDYLRGDLDASEEIKIGDVDLSAHDHSGLDGSSLIDGKYIRQKSIGKDAIKLEYEDKPSNLSLLGFSSSTTYAEAKFFWTNKNDNLINEVQLSRLPSVEFVDPGQEEPEPEQPEVPQVTGYIPPFESYSPLYIEWVTEIDYELFFN